MLIRILFLIVTRFVLKVLPTYHRKICGIIIVMTVKIVRLLHTNSNSVQFYGMIYAHFSRFCAERGSKIEFMHKFSESVQFLRYLYFVFLTLGWWWKDIECFVRFIVFGFCILFWFLALQDQTGFLVFELIRVFGFEFLCGS